MAAWYKCTLPCWWVWHRIIMRPKVQWYPYAISTERDIGFLSTSHVVLLLSNRSQKVLDWQLMTAEVPWQDPLNIAFHNHWIFTPIFFGLYTTWNDTSVVWSEKTPHNFRMWIRIHIFHPIRMCYLIRAGHLILKYSCWSDLSYDCPSYNPSWQV